MHLIIQGPVCPKHSVPHPVLFDFHPEFLSGCTVLGDYSGLHLNPLMLFVLFFFTWVIKYCTYLTDDCLFPSCGGSKWTKVYPSSFQLFWPVSYSSYFSTILIFSTSDISTRSFKGKPQKLTKLQNHQLIYIHRQEKYAGEKGWRRFRAFHQEASHLFSPFVLNVE